MRTIITLISSSFLALGLVGCTYEHHDHDHHRPPRVVEYTRVERVESHHGYHHHDGYYRPVYRGGPDCR